MPRYHFHFSDGDARIGVAEAVDLPDAEAAWYQAVRSARELIQRDLIDGQRWPHATVEIEDEEGQPIWALPFLEVAEAVA